MSKSILALLCAIVLGLGVIGGVSLRAADPAPTTQPAVSKPVNTKCMVSGEDIDPAFTLLYEGKTYGFCCEDCEKKFKADPQKYITAGK